MRRARQEQRLDRQERSVVYHLSPLLYRLLTPFYAIGRGFKKLWGKITGRVEHHRQVTPHRSFYLTTHAQAVRQINISGYLRFTHEVGRLIWDNKRLYLKALIVLTIALLTVIGFGVKDNYVNVREALQEAGLNGAFQVVGLITQAVITSLTVTNVNNQSYALLLALVAWMVVSLISAKIALNNHQHTLQQVQNQIAKVNSSNTSIQQEIAEATSQANLQKVAKKYGLTDANSSVRNVNR